MRMKSHIRIAFVVQLEGKRQLYPDIADLENFGFDMTMFLLTYLNATDVLLLCARQNTSWIWGLQEHTASAEPGTQDRPNP